MDLLSGYLQPGFIHLRSRQIRVTFQSEEFRSGGGFLASFQASVYFTLFLRFLFCLKILFMRLIIIDAF